MQRTIFPLLISLVCLAALAGCKTTAPTALSVMSEPPGAMATVHAAPDVQVGQSITALGRTPAQGTVNFYGTDRLWLRVEQRGYEPKVVEIRPDSASLSVTLDRAPLQDRQAEAPQVTSVMVLPVAVEIVERGALDNSSPAAESAIASDQLSKALALALADGLQVGQPQPGIIPADLTRPLERDGRTAMETMDPVRLDYLTLPPSLETKTARLAAKELGERYNVDAVLLARCNVDREAGSLVMGKAALFTVGTAASYASGYSRAMSQGGGTFAYTIYLPRFTEGTSVEAVLIHCATGQVLWLNKGNWPVVDLTTPESVSALTSDLLNGFPNK